MSVPTQLHQARAALWIQRFVDQKRSGLKVLDWCDANGVSRHAYYYWKKILKEDLARGESIPDIVPILESPMLPASSDVIVSDVPAVCNSSNLSDSRNSCELLDTTKNFISISSGDIKIELSSTVPDDKILRLIKAVRDV